MACRMFGAKPLPEPVHILNSVDWLTYHDICIVDLSVAETRILPGPYIHTIAADALANGVLGH